MRLSPPTAPLLALTLVLLAGCDGPDAGPLAPRAAPRPASAPASAPAGRVTQRSIAEFVAAQVYCTLPGNPHGCDTDIPGIDSQAFFDALTGNLVVLDYAGVDAAYLVANGGPDVGTTYSGTVTERVLNDGRAEISVVLRTENALTFVEDGTAPVSGSVIRFGATADQVLAGAPVALGSSTLRLTYIAPAPGLPLVSVTQVLYYDADTYRIVRLGFDGQAEGVLHAASGHAEGTPGVVRAKELDRHTTGLLRQGDPYRVEHVRLSPLTR